MNVTQTTIKKAVELVGIGLHKGNPVRLRLEPLEANSGIVFYRKDVEVSIPLKPENVVDTKMATVIGREGHFISTIEHLLSAVYAYGIDNLRVIVDADEVPVMDGSSASFCILLPVSVFCSMKRASRTWMPPKRSSESRKRSVSKRVTSMSS